MPTIDTTERADCTLVSVRTLTNPGGKLVVDSPTIPHPQPVYVVVGLDIDRCIKT